jgi:glucose/arabinose dehydrogenase
MTVGKGWIVVLILLAAVLGYRLFSSPLTPDVGTPDFVAPSQPPPRETPLLLEPPERLLEKELAVPERWKTTPLEGRVLHLPPGFEIGVFASGLPHARFMALDGEGNLYLSQPREGKISVLRDLEGDGVADEVLTYAEGLNLPHGLAFSGAWLYVAENDRVERLKDEDGDLQADRKELIIGDLPGTGGHFTRTIGFGPDGEMYVSVGSSCNVCEDDPRRAAILRFHRDGSGEEVFARGLRNSVGLVWHPETGEIWATDNGRDWLGDDLPPDEINIVRRNRHYGWPYCYGRKVPDPAYGDATFCEETEAPAVELQAHSAPLGLRFYEGDLFPEEYRGTLFVAYHGSWNRKVPTGYKIVRVEFQKGEARVEDFLTGWLTGEEKWGRPVDVLVGKDGSLLISDDYGGVIYRVSYSK